MTGRAFRKATILTVRRLILMRHAMAQRAGAGREDFDRALTAQGLADAALMGRVLAGQSLCPDLALVSTARRAQETWDAAAAAFPDAVAQHRRDLYLADADRLLDAVERLDPAAGTVMVVAHNPGIHDLAAALLRLDAAPSAVVARMARGFPTATAAVFAFGAAERWTYDGLFLAADHGGGGGE